MEGLKQTSFIIELKCYSCSRCFDPDEIQTYCPDCNSPLLVEYDLDAARRKLDRDEFQRRSAGMWRWQEILPVKDPEHIISLGEGDTPLLPLQNLGAELGLSRLYTKDESLNPTSSFKARGLSAALSKASELGVSRVIIPTAGNAGGAGTRFGRIHTSFVEAASGTDELRNRRSV